MRFAPSSISRAALAALTLAALACERAPQRRPERRPEEPGALLATRCRGEAAGAQPDLPVPDARLRLGPAVTLLAPGALGLRFAPDSAVVVVRAQPARLLLTAADSVYLVEGPSLDALRTARKVLAPGPPGSFDNGYVGIGGAYRAPDGRLFAFYSAEDHEGMPRLGSGAPGYHAAIGAAVSSDDGEHWEKLGPVVRSERGKGAVAFPGQTDTGLGEPGLVASKDGRSLFLYYTDHSRVGGQPVHVGMARADLEEGPPLPGRWRKLRGGRFTEPGLGGRDEAALRAPLGRTDVLFPHPTYSRFLDRYLLVVNLADWVELQAPRGALPARSGIALVESADGVHWGPPRLIVRARSVPRPGDPVSWEATIVWDDEEGRTGWLLYGHSPCWGEGEGLLPHHLVGRRLELSRP